MKYFYFAIFVSIFIFALAHSVFADNHEPWITLNFPSSPQWDGYKFYWRQEYSVMWFGNNIQTVDVFLMRENVPVFTIAENVPLDNDGGGNQWGSVNGQAKWTVSDSILPGDDYVILVQEHVSPGGTPRAKTSSGKVSVVVSARNPDEISSALVERKIINSVEKISELIVRDDGMFYTVEGIKRARLFFIVPLRMNIKLLVNAVSGEVISVEKPWWGFLAR